jgi:NAD(P)H-hydrate epimerase
VLTPHPGELARLLRTSAAGIQSNRLEHARSAARAYGCTVVLKGPGTVVAQRDGRAVIVGAGGPALATGGSGDVLTGCIAACLARGLPAPEAAAAGAYLHGLAGDLAEEKWGAPGAIAGDVPELLSEAIRRLQCGVWPLSYREV